MDQSDKDKLQALCIRMEPVGSRITCNPKPMDTDEDFILLFDSSISFEKIDFWIDDLYFESNQDDFYDKSAGEFMSYRKNEVNLIVTQDRRFFIDS